MLVVKITSKRQATLPKALCNDLGINPGAELRVEKRLVNGEIMWTLRPNVPQSKWFGSLRKYAKGKSHDMKVIRSSIGKHIRKRKY